jgi:serine protease Do
MRAVGRWIRCCALACWSAVGTLAAAQSPVKLDDGEVRAKVQALAQAHASVVGVRSVAVEDARSISSLGRERIGSGVVIGDDGLVVTIGYLILEADHVDLLIDGERVVPARVVAYDLASGFGLVQALTPLRVPVARLGSSGRIGADDPLMIASGGSKTNLSVASLVSRRDFSGYWEYHIENALFTSPPRMDHSGAALFNADGELLGIGSLVVLDALGAEKPRMAGNMFLPIDLLKDILPELRRHGATRHSKRAWLGLNCVEIDGMVRVARVMPDSPAEAAGLAPGDHIVRIDGKSVGDLTAFYKALWDGPDPEREVRLEISRPGAGGAIVTVQSQDRMRTLRTAKGI